MYISCIFLLQNRALTGFYLKLFIFKTCSQLYLKVLESAFWFWFPLHACIARQLSLYKRNLVCCRETHFNDRNLNCYMPVGGTKYCVVSHRNKNYECKKLVLLHEHLLLLHANNKGTDQPPHLHSLNSAFVIPFLENVIAKLTAMNM